MNDKIMKSLNGYTVNDAGAREAIEALKGSAPGLVFDTVTDMEAYVAEHSAELKIGQDLYIRETDAPDYWWDGTRAVPVETDMTAIRKEVGELEKVIADKAVGGGIWYGSTSTNADTTLKVVTTETGDFRLVRGARLGVKFLTNTYVINALNVDSTGEIAIKGMNDESGTTDTASVVWHNIGQVQWFTYDGTYFIADDTVRATPANGILGKVSVSDSVNSTGDTVASSKAVKTAYDKAVDALNAVTALDTALAAAIGSGVIS